MPNNQNYFVFSTGSADSTPYLKVTLYDIDIVNIKDDDSSVILDIIWNIIKILMVACCCVLCCFYFKCYECDRSSSSTRIHMIREGDIMVFPDISKKIYY